MSISLRHGFTTIRDLGTEGAGYADIGLRDAAREGIVPGPRILAAGPAIRSIGRYPLPGYQHSMTFPVGLDSCTGPVACRETVRTQVAYGIDCLKIYVSERFDEPAGEDGLSRRPAGVDAGGGSGTGRRGAPAGDPGGRPLADPQRSRAGRRRRSGLDRARVRHLAPSSRPAWPPGARPWYRPCWSPGSTPRTARASRRGSGPPMTDPSATAWTRA